MTAKALLRRLIVASSIFPVAAAYHAVYRASIRLAVRRLRKFPSLRAIYLRRGLAAGPGIPGISDIDLTVVGDWDAAVQSRIVASHRRLARAFPLYDPDLGIFTPHALLDQQDPFVRHRVAEGRKNWRLLYGEDCLGQMAPVTDDEAAVGYESEFRYWWIYLARVVIGGWRLSDTIFVNSLCYKAITESIRMDCGLRGLPLPPSRQAAIEGTYVEYLVRLRGSAARRHLSYRGDIVDDTLGFLLPFLERSYRDLRAHPAWRAQARVRIDAPAGERVSASDGFSIDWGRVTFHAGSTFAMDELIILCEPADGKLPSASTLRATARRCAEVFRNSRSRTSLYLRLSSLAVQFYTSDQYLDWQAILWPGANPDIFGDASGGWTAPAAGFIHRERQLFADGLDDPATYKANNLDFLRMFWKFLALIVAEHSAGRGEAILAQTPEAVLRALKCWNAPSRPFLENFATAYRDELAGKATAIGRDLPAAIEYLRTIHNEL